MRLGIIRIDAQHSPIFSDGSLHVTLLLEGKAEMKMRLDMIRIDAQHRLVLCDCTLHVALHPEY